MLMVFMVSDGADNLIKIFEQTVNMGLNKRH